ncbi:unnamed protein product [Echinostoma caproni]|uniref:PHM7_ext domain-containing protein n=1 Tax=Echinostoma caproni TaxID=27848 RepID=A0A183ADM1_9TREM|nr:unnamed protein product [Echinostoma caproni]
MGNKVISKPQLQYTQTIDRVVDPSSGQAVMGRFELYPLWKSYVKGDQPFNKDVAQALLTKHREKRLRSDRALQPVRRKCAAFFLVDRVHFRGYHFDHWLSYRQILEVHRCFPLASVFLLFVIDSKTYRRSYESYECVYAEDAKRIEEIYRQVLNDPQRMVETEVPPEKLGTSINLIRPHWTYRDETGYNDYIRAAVNADDAYSWESVNSDYDEHSQSLAESDHVYAKAREERHSGFVSVASTARESRIIYMSQEEMENLPVARRLTHIP